jgi:hypothetical protein
MYVRSCKRPPKICCITSMVLKGFRGALRSLIWKSWSCNCVTSWVANCSSNPSSIKPSSPSLRHSSIALVAVDRLGRAIPKHVWCALAPAPPTGKSLPPIATTVARLFFPQSKSLGIDLGSFSPGLLKKIVYAGSNHPSFESASESMQVLAEASVAVKQIERLTQQIGKERQDERDVAAAAYLAQPLAQREETPSGVTPPPLAVVEMDGGRLQIRTPDEKPAQAAEACRAAPAGPPMATVPLRANDSPASAATHGDGPPQRVVKSKHWREDKVGCLLEMSSAVSDSDPCPEIPAVFVDPLGALKLAQEIGHCAVPPGTPFHRAEAEAEEAPPEDPPSKRPGRPEIDNRHVVASRRDIDGFGPLLAATACSLGLFGAARRAFVADGSSENWSVYRRYFSRWTPVLDFVHALTYVYAAAMAGRTFAEGWPVYEQWIGWVWGGLVSNVIEALTSRQAAVGEVTPSDPEGSPRRVIQEALTYLSNHQQKMRYNEYRRQGLPLMSSHVESTVKQINYRVKGTEKFWTDQGAEAILQLRADYLSDGQPMEDFWQRRQAAATGQRRYRQRAA